MDGPHEPEAGHRFNASKVLLDPYAKAIARTIRWGDEMFGYPIGDETADLGRDERDNAHQAPLAAVIDPAFTWGEDAHPRTPWHQTVIYELHVKGFTRSLDGRPPCAHLAGWHRGPEHLKAGGTAASSFRSITTRRRIGR